MELVDQSLNGLLLLRPRIFGDERGYFFESYNQEAFRKILGNDVHFVQDNQSMSQKNVLRGLHFQAPPNAQAKLVRVIAGSVLDVVVDIRKKSSSFGQHYAVELSAENHLQLYIPEGFAHGFLTLEDQTLFSYKCSNYYHQPAEGSILWSDPTLRINWKTDTPMVSQKDRNAPLFQSFKTPF